MNFIIAAETAENTMTGLEKLGLGGRTLLIGLVMVFVVLGILIGLVSLNKIILPKIEKFFANLSAKRKEKKELRKLAKMNANSIAVESKDVKALPNTNVVPEVQVPNTSANNEEEVVAAITAAISLYYEQQMVSTGKTVKFRVRSIKEIR